MNTSTPSTAASSERLSTPAITPTPTAAITPTATLRTTPTHTANCFGSIKGSVIVDANRNGQVDANEPGMMGATVFLRNTAGVVGLYTTGNGQFDFPGLVAGAYTLTATPPEGYSPVGSMSFELNLSCGAILTQNILVVPSATSDTAPTPTPQSRSKITPVANAQITPRSSRASASPFKPFEVAAVYDLAGCGAITAPGLYRLTQSLVSKWDCIQVYSDNVILDCQGHSLNGVDGNGYGVVIHHVGNILNQRPPRNIEIRNCRSSTHKYGIFVDAADNLYIHDNIVSDNFRDVDDRNFGIFLGLAEGGGMRIGDTRNALIANNQANNSAIGIDVRNSSGIMVRGNTANGNSAWGIHFYNVKWSEIAENNVADNLRYCTWGSGVVGAGCDAGGIMLQSGSSNNIVRDNVITGSNGNGIFIKAHGTPCGDGNIISGNRITGALYNAIELSFCRDNKIQGNVITNSLDGIWLGFARNNTINAGNELRDLANHGIISWNSSENNVSTNRIINSREGLYFYSSDYDREQFFFVPGAPEDHISRGNCLCDNTLEDNVVAAIHLNNSLKNQITNNRMRRNGVNFWMEGNTAGNIIEDNIIQGGSYHFDAPRVQHVGLSGRIHALVVYDVFGRPLPWSHFVKTIVTDSPDDSFDLRWFKLKLRLSLGIAPTLAPTPRLDW